MRILMLLSALVSWATGGRRQSSSAKSRTTVRVMPPPPLPPRHWIAAGPKEAVCLIGACGCPLCDRGLPTLLDRRPERDNPYRHGWYSAENDKALGHYFCEAVAGGAVKVTNVTQSSTSGLAVRSDAVYVGELVSPAPCPPPLPMTKERAEFVAALLKRAFSGRTATTSHTSSGQSDTRTGGHLRRITVVEPSDAGAQVLLSLGGFTWFLDGHVGIQWGKDGPELWSETKAGSGADVRSTFAPEGHLEGDDFDLWRAAWRALWSGKYFPVPGV